MVRNRPSKPLQRLSIPGPAGALAASFEQPQASPVAAVLCLHPHPMHGGTRQNNVVRHGALGALQANCLALRIDFRGVGDSEGEYDEGVGEIEDAQAAYDWLQQNYPELPILIWGFSFGSRVGLDLAIRLRDEIHGYIAVAWPTNFYAWPESNEWPTKTGFIAGTEDEYVDLTKMNHAEQLGGKITIVDGASHFFPKTLDRVRDLTADYITEFLND